MAATEDAGLVAVMHANACGASATGGGDAGVALRALALAGARRRAGAVGVTTADTLAVVHAGEAVAVGVALATLCERATTTVARILTVVLLREGGTGDIGSDCCASNGTGDGLEGLAAAKLAVCQGLSD